MNVIPSWGDMTLVYGPGTDAAMDSPQAMENMVRHWKGRGFTGLYLRTDLIQFPPGAIIRHEGNTQPQPTLAVAWHLIDEILARSDPHRAARRAADKIGGFEYWMWHPHIYSEGAPADVGVPGPGRMVPWSYMRTYHKEHPEVITIDREGNKQWMVPEYAYPGARADKAAEFAYMAKTYHPTGIIASMRSESSQLIPPPEHADQFGFSPIIVDEMKRLYKVDILTDPRFDWKSPSFNSADPMLENWRNLRGSYITQLYRDIRQAMRQADPKVKFAVTLSGEYVGPIIGNARLEWRKWIDEGIIDVMIMSATFEATLDLDSAKKGYLTDVRAGKGLVSVQQVKDYIRKSSHPDIKVIQTGAPSYFYDVPPKGADGWQCDVWYDSYHAAWYERWQQLQKDLAERGQIAFFEQSFNELKPKDPGISGGVGDGRYDPAKRSCPGVWYTLGNGTDAKPYVEQEVRHGNSGNAIAPRGKEITALHWSSPDRSQPTGVLDPAIVNGKAMLTCWVYRPSEQSALTVYFTGNASVEKDVAIRIEPKSGRVSYADGKEWKQSQATVPLKRWTPISIEVDADAARYSATAGEDKAAVCSGIAYAPPAERFVTEHGVNLPIKVPSYRIFNMLMFVPAEGSKEPVYLDDVRVTWKPTIAFAPRGARKLFAEDFESSKAGVMMKNFAIEKTTSYGEGVHCARASGGGELAADLVGATGPITVDLDVFIRSDKDFPYILPDPTTKSSHSVAIALQGGSADKPFAAADTKGDTWHLWDGDKYIDTGKRVTYDVWNHVQIAVDPQARTYRLVVQPVGEMPMAVGQATCGQPDGKLKLSIRPSEEKGHLSCYDNIVVTSN